MAQHPSWRRHRLVLPALAWAALAWAALAWAAPAAALANDLVTDSVPQKWIDSFLPEQLPDLSYPPYFDELDKAKAQSFAGRYKLSLQTLARRKDVKPDVAAAVALIRSESLLALGRAEAALKAASEPAVADLPEIQVRRAEILAAMGRDAEAVELLKKHLQAHPDSLAGHYTLGTISEKIGDLDAARQAFGWFVGPPQQFLEKWKQNPNDPLFDSAADLTTIGRAIDRWASLTEAYRDQVGLHQQILNLFLAAYDVKDRAYWPAHVAAAEYFISHDNNKEAAEELKAALAGNPQEAHAWQLFGRIALESFNFDGADKAIAALRKVDRDSVAADLLEARNLLHQRRAKEAEVPIARVLQRQPHHLEALGLHAATFALQLLEEQANEVLAKVDSLDPDNATAYFDVAEQLGAMRQYPRAIARYKTAIERAPWWTAARNGLGLLYTQSGDEDEARAALEEARKLDPFNLATTNYLRLLDDMDQFARKETEHFILLYDAEQDPIIPEYFADYLESIHADVTDDFNHEPSVKTIIEVFPSHDQFSVRTTGSPWIGTVGASTGRVIALCTPRVGENTLGTYNWAQVLRHEYTHTVTLSATDNRIAHWMTEGLAVLEEEGPLRWDWVPMLYRAVKTGELFTLDELTWAFVRPKKPHHRTLGYAQSFWVCRYIEQTQGREALLKMLAEFKAGGRQEDVFPKVLGRSISQFQQEFFAWAAKQVSTWGYDEATTNKYRELKPRADALSRARQDEAAIKAWQEIHAIRPMDPLPRQRLAVSYLALKKYPEAIEQLDALHQAELKDNRYGKRIARLYRDLKRWDKATQYAMQAVYIDPYDVSAHELLLDIHEKSGNAEGLEREQRVIPVLKKWHAAQQRMRDEGLPGTRARGAVRSMRERQ